MTPQLADHEGMITKVAIQAHRRLMAAGVTWFDFEDVKQEMLITFLKVVESWDESKGRLSTYYITAAHNNFNRLADKIIGKETSLQFEATNDEHPQTIVTQELIEAASLIDGVDRSSTNPLDEVEAADYAAKVMATLSPLAQMIVEMLQNPPGELLEEFEALQAKKQMSRRLGLRPENVRTAVDLSVISRFLMKLGFARHDVAAAREEIQYAAV